MPVTLTTQQRVPYDDGYVYNIGWNNSNAAILVAAAFAPETAGYMRFDTSGLPSQADGHTITAAKLTLITYFGGATGRGNITVNIYAEHQVNPAHITDQGDANFRLGDLCTAFTAWTFGPPTTGGISLDTSDITAIIQELLGLAGDGGCPHMQFFLTGRNGPNASSPLDGFDCYGVWGDPDKAPVLSITYTSGLTMTISASNPVAVRMDQAAGFNYSMSGPVMASKAALSELHGKAWAVTESEAVKVAVGFLTGYAFQLQVCFNAAAGDHELLTLLKGVHATLNAGAALLSEARTGKSVLTTLRAGTKLTEAFTASVGLGVAMSAACLEQASTNRRNSLGVLAAVRAAMPVNPAVLAGAAAFLNSQAALSPALRQSVAAAFQLYFQAFAGDTALEASRLAASLSAGAGLQPALGRASPLSAALSAAGSLAELPALHGLASLSLAASAALSELTRMTSVLSFTGGTRAAMQEQLVGSLVMLASLAARASEARSLAKLTADASVEAVAAGLSGREQLVAIGCATQLGAAAAAAEAVVAVKAVRLLLGAAAAAGVSLSRQLAVAATSLTSGVGERQALSAQQSAAVALAVRALVQMLETTSRYDFSDMNDINFTSPTITGETFSTDPQELS